VSPIRHRQFTLKGNLKKSEGTESPVNVAPLREIIVATQSVPSQSVLLRENVLVEPRRVGSLRRQIIETLLEWRRRMRSRQELALLSQLELKDIGYPARVEVEKAKPFWRA
jgi:uncharacterized protein YjiS (DUF1127 family)